MPTGIRGEPNQTKNHKSKKSKKKKREKEKKNLFSVVFDKMCVFNLYPILDSQQHVKMGSCRHPILYGLLCLFSFLIWPRAHLWQDSSLGLEPIPLCHYLFYRVFESFCFNYYFVLMFVLYINCILYFKCCFVFNYVVSLFLSLVFIVLFFYLYFNLLYFLLYFIWYFFVGPKAQSNLARPFRPSPFRPTSPDKQ